MTTIVSPEQDRNPWVTDHTDEAPNRHTRRSIESRARASTRKQKKALGRKLQRLIKRGS